MMFYPFQVHTLSLTTFECRSSHARQQDHSSSLSLTRTLASSRSFSSFVSRVLSLSLPRHGELFILFVARTIRGTGPPFISVTRSLYLSTWPTHRNKFHPPTLPFTHFSPADHPLRIGNRRFAYLVGRSFGDRPIGWPSDRKNETKGHFFLRRYSGILSPRYVAVITHA